MTVRTKKIILWLATIAAAIGLFFWWVKNAQKTISNFRGKEFIERLNFPAFKMPNIEEPKEELGNKIGELKELIKNAEEETTTTTE